jgi:hypothetical protein
MLSVKFKKKELNLAGHHTDTERLPIEICPEQC